MRKAIGSSLVEMVVAVALSGTFILLLSGMLSQTLLLSTAGQNEQTAAYVAETILENARVMSYNEISNSQLGTELGQPINLIVNYYQPSSLVYPQIRLIPVQLDLTNVTKAFGEDSGQSSQLNPTGLWAGGTGNYFNGLASITASNGLPTTSINSYLITVHVSYSGVFSAANAQTRTKTLTRSAYVFQNGGQLQ